MHYIDKNQKINLFIRYLKYVDKNSNKINKK